MVSPLHAFCTEGSWRVDNWHFPSFPTFTLLIPTLSSTSEETWLCICTPTNQAQPGATATRENIDTVKHISRVNTIQGLLSRARSARHYVPLGSSHKEACVGLLHPWNRSSKAKAACWKSHQWKGWSWWMQFSLWPPDSTVLPVL